MKFEARSFSPQNMKEMENKELDGNITSQSTQTEKGWMGFSHLSCRLVGVRTQEMLN